MNGTIFTPETLAQIPFGGTTAELSSENIPVTARVAHPLNPNLEWFIYGKEEEDEDILLCFANLNDPIFAELGTVRLTELESVGVLLDKKFVTGSKTLQQVMDEVQDKI